MEEVDANPGLIFDKLDTWLDGFFRLLPNIAIALVVIAIFYVIARLISGAVRRAAARRDRPSLADVASSLVKWIFIIVGVMLAITIVAPSVKPGDLIAGLGVGSVAIGFAFKDILQNMLAGILILLRQPFAVGDQIVSGGHEGTVERIETRATLIKTYDGRRVVIPNADIYTDSVVVLTAYDQLRSELDVGIGCNDDWARARQILEETCRGIEGVLPDPAPETIPVAQGDFANIIRLRWWTKSPKKDRIHVRGEVIQATYIALDEAGIDLPYPTQVHLFHDQTEESDGIRSRQREGWPTQGQDPRSREQTKAERAAQAGDSA
ncbi:mechanosensitive ion channel family protein [Salipiger sp. IMCC34102]|uniref:mechanosensitive ion channel family protein n=1 Tax=Salipiger sp. IMCC34102 TaxID=2510647 RepID=UPI00101DD0BB|nr:mechanosensitive ion channel family protein [Salipiger sp. IMCC34102]RYH02787.1 mechanosensitive ion channel family protein [Salipiger sp. IMCC34102]